MKNGILNIYKTWKVSKFLERLNRFTLLVELNRKTEKAYLPNTGRLEEHLIPGRKIFLTPVKTPRFNFKAISTMYHGYYVLLDTTRMTEIFLEAMRNREKLFDIYPVKITKEHRINKSRFDICIKDTSDKKHIIELKSCTLCHNGTAMFPDAPSKRAVTHVEELGRIADTGIETWIIFLIPGGKANRFIPNIHTDFMFSRFLLENSKSINIRAYNLKMISPVEIDLNSINQVKVDFSPVRESLSSLKGSYVIILENNRDKTVKIGNLGPQRFQKGYYVYVGSALNNLTARIKRHRIRRKSIRWHIDYITPFHMKIVKEYPIVRPDRIEPKLASDILNISCSFVDGFGSSDSPVKSHLFYFKERPDRMESFIKIIMDYRTYTEM